MSIVKLYDSLILGDERGSLVVLDKPSGVPFEIKRVYYIFGTTGGVSRGFHAHKKLHQIAFCISGSCRMIVDDGNNKEDFMMDSPSVGIDLSPMLWHEMHDFSADCVLLVIASDEYDEADYIRDYDVFKEASCL
jgi:dTDP-4-dehydrorhamnose 3,5-epimerase-like enzyme